MKSYSMQTFKCNYQSLGKMGEKSTLPLAPCSSPRSSPLLADLFHLAGLVDENTGVLYLNYRKLEIASCLSQCRVSLGTGWKIQTNSSNRDPLSSICEIQTFTHLHQSSGDPHLFKQILFGLPCMILRKTWQLFPVFWLWSSFCLCKQTHLKLLQIWQ